MLIGKHILGILTDSMYSDHRIMYREYIQNSCDSIRAFIKSGYLKENEGKIYIEIDKHNRNIEFTDNGAGIPKSMFESKIKDIANSDKDATTNMGFRGIGHLIGLAYCSKIQFISKAYGEEEICIATYDAKKMQALINDEKKYSVQEVIEKIYKVEFKRNPDVNDHYFKVCLNGIVNERDDLLNIDNIRQFLSFVSPIPYSSHFVFFNKIKEFARELKTPLEEYKIYVNDQQIFKEYTTSIYSGNGEKKDEIKDIRFNTFKDDKDCLLGWMWFGISSFDGAITSKENNPQRCIRVRKHNIQIGENDTLRRLFKEGRGNSYFVGELFAVHNDLTPNARRDDFVGNYVYELFQCKIKDFFYTVLHKLYHDASDLRSALKDFVEYAVLEEEVNAKENTGYSGKEEEKQIKNTLKIQKEKSDNASEKIKKIEEKNSSDQLFQTIKGIVEEKEFEKAKEKIQSKERKKFSKPQEPQGYLPDQLKGFDDKTKKVISLIYDTIHKTEPTIAQRLIETIQHKLSKITTI